MAIKKIKSISSLNYFKQFYWCVCFIIYNGMCNILSGLYINKRINIGNIYQTFLTDGGSYQKSLETLIYITRGK